MPKSIDIPILGPVARAKRSSIVPEVTEPEPAIYGSNKVVPTISEKLTNLNQIAPIAKIQRTFSNEVNRILKDKQLKLYDINENQWDAQKQNSFRKQSNRKYWLFGSLILAISLAIFFTNDSVTNWGKFRILSEYFD